MPNRACSNCRRTLPQGDIRQRDPRTGNQVCSRCLNHPSQQPNKIDVTATKETPTDCTASPRQGRRYRVREMYGQFVVWDTQKDASVKMHPTRNAAQKQAKGLNEEHEDRMAHPDEYNGHTSSLPPLRVLAHDGGDGEVIRHCYACGSGGVVGRSDGTTECTVCGSFFTVQVQPRNVNSPQTVNGVPVHIPGMPEESEVTPGVSDLTGNAPPAIEDTTPMPGIEDADLQEYMTATGAKVDEESFVQYLALTQATPRQRVHLTACLREINAARHSR